MTEAPTFPVPCHVGIIMDGNGRWAKRKGWARLQGHEAGVDAVRDVTTAAASWGIEHLTLYAFSVENWQRPKMEIAGLMRFLKKFLRVELETLLENRVRLKGLGDLEALPADVLEALREAEEATSHGDRMTLRLALSYGGRQEIAFAAKELARNVAQGKKKLEDVTVESLTASLYDADMPDVDLVIRTAGELRLSNFLLWQASYAEFSFSSVLWPDFRRGDLKKALEDFDHRVRKFGLVLDADSGLETSI